MIPAGRLRHLITIQQKVDVTTLGSGEQSSDWAEYTQVWAEFRPLRGREFFAAGQMQAALDAVFAIRWRNDIDPASMRVVMDGDPYEISEPPINVDGQYEDLELMCVKGIRDGR